MDYAEDLPLYPDPGVMAFMPHIPDPSFIKNDPVTKALVNNILGKLPTKKPREIIKCELCSMEFSSKIPYEMHIKGQKHNKKLNAKRLLETMQGESANMPGAGTSAAPQDVGQDEATNAKLTKLECNVCKISVNSPQQLQLHYESRRHKENTGEMPRPQKNFRGKITRRGLGSFPRGRGRGAGAGSGGFYPEEGMPVQDSPNFQNAWNDNLDPDWMYDPRGGHGPPVPGFGGMPYAGPQRPMMHRPMTPYERPMPIRGMPSLRQSFVRREIMQ